NGSTHSYQATATDAAGNTSGNSNTFTATIDTAAPAAPVVTGRSGERRVGNGDGITSDTSLSVTGTAEANSTVTVFDGVTQLGTTTASGAGAWTYVDTRTLTNGSTYSYKATATDAAGNTSGNSNTFTATIDTAAPAAPVVTG